MGTRASQFLWCDVTTFHGCSSTFLMQGSTMSDCGFKDVVSVLLTHRHCKTSLSDKTRSYGAGYNVAPSVQKWQKKTVEDSWLAMT